MRRMHFTPMTRLAAAALVLSLWGCALPSISREPAPGDEAEVRSKPLPSAPFQAASRKYSRLAAESEKNGDPRRALLLWEVARGLDHDNDEAARKMKNLNSRLQAEAKRHVRSGMESLEKGEQEAARREFLMALAHDPDNRQALEYVKSLTAEQDFIPYTTKEGDTPRKVAEEAYGDPAKEFLVAYFNDLTVGTPLQAGLNLSLPRVDRVSAPLRRQQPAEAPDIVDELFKPKGENNRKQKKR